MRLIITDFDGVILESEPAKDEAFRRFFAASPAAADAAVRYHLAHPELDRYEKLEHVYSSILCRPYGELLRGQVQRQFDALVQLLVSQAPEVPGAAAFLERFQGILPIELVSATPRAPLLAVLEARGLRRCFRNVHASAAHKAPVLRRILCRSGLGPHEAVFIGDTNRDLAAAQAAGVLFVGRRNREPFSGPRLAELPDLRPLPALIDRLMQVQPSGAGVCASAPAGCEVLPR